MLIALTGPQGCGKTTIIEALEEKGYNIIKRKTARSVLEDWQMSLEEIYADRTLHMKFQDELIDRKVVDERSDVRAHGLCFTERSYVDTFVYAAQSLSRFNDCNEWLNRYYETCKQNQVVYNATIYIRGGHFEVAADGVRGHNPHYAKMIELMMEHYYHDMQHPKSIPLIIDTPKLNDRILQITELVQYLLNKNKKEVTYD